MKIKKCPNFDKEAVTRERLLEATKNHIEDVKMGMKWFADRLIEAGKKHDHTKIDDFEGFFKIAQVNFDENAPGAGEWWKIHISTERHHIKEHEWGDVNLIDVLEMIVDCVMSGMARRGSVYIDNVDGAMLKRAYVNTMKLLRRQVDVERDEKD